MKIFLCSLLSIAAALWAGAVGAQEVWAYQIVGPGARLTTQFTAPADLTYPPPGVRNVVVDENSPTPPRGTPISRGEEAKRRSSGQLVIILMPRIEADHLASPGLR